MTQEAAAERIDCAVAVLQRLERAASAVTVDFVASVASGYRIDIGELFRDAGPWQQPRPGRPRSTTGVTTAAGSTKRRKAKR